MSIQSQREERQVITVSTESEGRECGLTGKKGRSQQDRYRVRSRLEEHRGRETGHNYTNTESEEERLHGHNYTDTE